MAFAIQSAFSTMRSNLEITGLQSNTVSNRQSNIRGVLEDGFKVLTTFLTGSYARSTMIAPLGECDIDIFCILAPEYFTSYSPSQLLDQTRAVLLKTYTTTPKISRNGQAVTITFSDFQVDVVPGFYRNGGGYLIPDSIHNRWISTDPTVHDANLAQANRIHDGNLVPLIKMIKGWNRCINEAFIGFYLEQMVIEILNNVQISDYPSGVRFVFDRGREAIRRMISDPAGFGDQIAGLNSISGVEDAISRFNTAYSRAIRAEQFAQNDNLPAAFEEWRKIFPRYFPAYG